MTPRQRRLGLVLMAVVALNAIVYAAYTLPRSLRERSVASRLEVLQREVDLEQRRVSEIKERSTAVEANARDRQRFMAEAVKPAGSDLVPILRDIETAARNQGLQVGTQRFDREEVKGLALERFKIQMPIAGTYVQLIGLLRALEDSPHFLTLDQISVRGEGGGGRVQLDMMLSCYFRGEPGA